MTAAVCKRQVFGDCVVDREKMALDDDVFWRGRYGLMIGLSLLDYMTDSISGPETPPSLHSESHAHCHHESINVLLQGGRTFIFRLNL